MNTLLHDLRHAVRLLVKARSFTIVALATLAIGIAANAAIFSIVSALLLRPLPYAEPERLVMLWQDLRARGGPADEWLSAAHFFDWRGRSRSLESSAVFRGGVVSLTGTGEPEQLAAWLVSADFFGTLGVRPSIGRDFQPDDDRPGAPATAILTHGLWVRRFGADPAIVGRAISLNREPVVVIGVLPPSYQNPFDGPALFRPLQLNPAGAPRNNVTLRMIARLRSGVSLDEARGELASIGAALAAEHPESSRNSTIAVARLHDRVVGNLRTPVLALLGAVVLVLLIACANIGSLQLARASARTREIAVRTALGASRTRIVRQLLTENVLLGGLGSMAGLLLSAWLLEALVALAPRGTPRLAEMRVDGSVAVFAVLLAVATSVVFGLVPALQSVRGNLSPGIREGGRGAGGAHPGVAARSAFVVAELALTLMLLVAAGLLMQTLGNIRAVDPGFAPDRVISADLALPSTGYEDPAQVRSFYRALIDRLDDAPGVEAAGLVSVMPFSGNDTDTVFLIDGRPRPADPGALPTAWYRLVSPGYARAIGLRMEAGRFIGPEDRDDAPRVVVINRTLANRYWPGENPIGRRIRSEGGDGGPWTIVGIVSDVHHRSLRESPRGEMYLSEQQFATRRQTIVIKAAAPPAAVVPVLRERIAALDPNLPLSNVTTLDAAMAESLALPRMIALLMGAFAAASLMLAGVGVYGLVAYTVTLRRQEFGVRMALGAAAGDVLRLVLGQAARLAVLGLAFGGLASLAATRMMRTLLFGVSASDVTTFGATALLLTVIALAASYIPARRAVGIDPVAALRSE